MPVPSVRAAALAVAGAACLLVPAIGAAAPSFQVVDAGPAVAGLSSADQIAGELLSPGVALAGPATINGTATAGAYAGALPSFGRFSAGDADLGIPAGLIIGANARASSFATGGFDDVISTDRDDNELFDVVDAAGLCNGGATACINNATSLELSVVPTARYLKFEYALAITEQGTWGGSSWSGEVFDFPDGFALFAGGRQVSDNCAVVPRTSTYVTMQTAGIVAPAVSGTNRSVALSNRDARIADTASPPTTPDGFAYAAQDGAWTVQFMTVPLTCVADVNADFLAGTPTGIKIVVADANDSMIPPAVFLRGGSIRFSDNETPSPTVDAPAGPGGPPATTPAPVPAPPAPAAPSGEVITPLAPPTVTTPRAGTSGDVVMVHRIQFDKVGRYTFIYRDAATGKRITQLPGSKVGKRELTSRYSAPVLRNQTPGRRLVVASRFDARTFPKAASGVSLRIVLKAPDGTLSDVTMDSEGRLS